MFALQNNRGSAGIVAVFTVIILSIFAAGIIPRASTELNLSTKNKDSTEAVFAAEAGAKRVLVGFLNYSNDWSWLKVDQQFAGSNQMKYNVTVKNSANVDIASSSYPAVDTYTITSTGTVNGASKTITVSVKMPAGYAGRGAQAGAWNIPSDVGMYASTISLGNNVSIGVGGAKTYVGTGGLTYGNNTTPITAKSTTIQVPQFDIGQIKAAAGTQTALPTANNSNLSGVYYIDGPLTLGQGTPNMTANNAIIYVNGDLNITDNSFTLNGTVAIIANNIIIKNNANLDQPLLIAYDDITIKNNLTINGGGTFIAGGTLDINNNASFNLKTNSNSNLFGLLQGYLGNAAPALYNWKEGYSI